MKKNIIITILATTVVLFVALLIIGLSIEDEPVKQTTNSSSLDTFRNNFMSGCNEDGKNYPYCSCAFYDLMKQNGEDKLLKISMQYAVDGIIPQELIDSANECINLYNL